MTQTTWYYRLPVKVAVFILTALLTAGGLFLLGTGGGAVLLAENGDVEDARQSVASAVLDQYALDILNEVGADPESIEKWLDGMPITYTLELEPSGEKIGNHDDGDFLAMGSANHSWGEYSEGDQGEIVQYTRWLTLYADTELYGDSLLTRAVGTITAYFESRLERIIGGLVCWLLVLVGAIYLHHAAGRHAEKPGFFRTWFDRIPADLLTAAYAFAAWVEVLVLDDLTYGMGLYFPLALFAVVAVDVPFVMLYTMSLATRIKTRTLWSGTVIGFILTRLWRAGVALVNWLPLIWKTVAVITGLSIVEFLFILNGEMDNVAVFWLIEKLVLIPLTVLFIIGLRRLQKGAALVAGGQTDYQIDTAYLPGDLKRSAEDLNHIGDGLTRAVEERLKSERFKTELITNVSHDIKTPLTSIVNYVDLLAKEPTDNENVREYTAVLSRQAARLKKLTEDLVEASKASTGNLPVSIEPCGLDVLLEQMVGEYSEKAASANLDLRLRLPGQPVIVPADGRHLWRVLDNLMNNVCKYALSGTRVYVDLTAIGGVAQITFRNVSREPIACEGDELTERFVRGDSSRNTEGSGLGLAIARSLTELQGGQMAVTVDGDLFKVAVTFPLAHEEKREV